MFVASLCPYASMVKQATHDIFMTPGIWDTPRKQKKKTRIAKEILQFPLELTQMSSPNVRIFLCLGDVGKDDDFKARQNASWHQRVVTYEPSLLWTWLADVS